MRLVVKLGGSLLTEKSLLEAILDQVAVLQSAGHEVMVVHGGGKQIKYYLEQLRIPSQFHNGLRVTNRDTLEVVVMVLAGLVNKEIIGNCGARGLRAVGLCGGDGQSFLARKFQDDQTAGPSFDYGFVGEVTSGNSHLVDLLLREKYLPVIACVALGENGGYYNVNADEMAAAVAIFCQAERLIFLTDVAGVYDGERQLICNLTRLRMRELRAGGIISEGMLPKTRACEKALDAGIRQVHIVGGKERSALTRVLMDGEPLGTLIH